MEQIGTVEILVNRVYPLDPKIVEESIERTYVWVTAGTVCPVVKNKFAYLWLMTGEINTRGFDKIGDGMFAMNQGDGGNGIQVTFPSKTFGEEEFIDLLSWPICLEGPQQRLRFRLDK